MPSTPGWPWRPTSALAALVGHNWSVFIRFQGGKGIATGVGALCALSPIAGLIALLVGVPTIALSRYVSLGSVAGATTGAIAVPVLAMTDPSMTLGVPSYDYAIYTSIGVPLIILKHRSNLARLVRGAGAKDRRIGAPERDAGLRRGGRMTRVTVVGTTSWGTTLAILLANNGSDVSLWARTEEEAVGVTSRPRENPRLPPGSTFPPGLSVTVIAGGRRSTDADMVVVSVPSRSLRENMRRLNARTCPATQSS